MDFYGEPPNRIDLREELHAIIYGRADMVPQGAKIVLRRLTDDHCECWDKLTGGPRQNCSFCKGEGWEFRETEETMVMFAGKAPLFQGGLLGNGQFPFTATGYDDPNKGTAICEYSVFPDYERFLIRKDKAWDRIYELKVDDLGNVVYPQIRTSKWKIVTVTPMRGDFSRVEYFVLGLEKEYL